MQISEDEYKKLMFRFDDLEREIHRVERNALTFWRVFFAVIAAVVALWVSLWVLGLILGGIYSATAGGH